MGKGKGEPEYWAAVVKPGTVIFEIGGVTAEIAKVAMNRVAHKLKVSTRLVTRRSR
jgi:large subunit ribosomal protein L16